MAIILFNFKWRKMKMEANNILPEKYQKKDNETDFEYGLRLIEIKMEDKPYDLDWQDITEILNLNIHRDSLRKACQTEFGGYNVMKYFKEKLLKLNTTENETDNILEQHNEKIRELQKERIKLQDERRQYNSFLRNEARWEEIKGIIESEAKLLNVNKPFLPNNTYLKDGKQVASLLISDLHIGIEVNTYLNTYNIDTAKKYMKTLEEKVINYCKIHNVKELNLEILGDLISGLIHVTTRIYQQENVINQTMICAEILSEMIYNLSKTSYTINSLS
jgi:hypothetical protein